MRRGATPTNAALEAIKRIAKHYPKFVGGVIAIDKNGEYGAACNGIPVFPFYVGNPTLGKAVLRAVPCTNNGVTDEANNTGTEKRLENFDPTVTVLE